MNSRFKIIQVEDWQSAKGIATCLDFGWVFRGHSNASWSLETTIFRGSHTTGYHPPYIAAREQEILFEFQRRAHHYIADPPSLDLRIEWLALVRHFGGPARLLDFSHSFYVASFFAVEHATTDAVIWAINRHKLMEMAGKKLAFQELGSKRTVIRDNVARIEALLRSRKPPSAVLYVEPERMNERLAVQQGLFLMPCNIDKSFETNLAATFKFRNDLFQKQPVEQWTAAIQALCQSRELPLLKLIIPRRCLADTVHDLRRMNITSASLFPGLDGFARSLHYYLQPTNTSRFFWTKNKRHRV